MIVPLGVKLYEILVLQSLLFNVVHYHVHQSTTMFNYYNTGHQLAFVSFVISDKPENVCFLHLIANNSFFNVVSLTIVYYELLQNIHFKSRYNVGGIHVSE